MTVLGCEDGGVGEELVGMPRGHFCSGHSTAGLEDVMCELDEEGERLSHDADMGSCGVWR